MSYSFHKGETWIIDAKFDIGADDTLSAVSFRVTDLSTGIAVAALSVGDGITIVNANEGTATIQFSDLQAAPLTSWGRYAYEAFITTGSGIKEVQAEGAWVVLPSLHA